MGIKGTRTLWSQFQSGMATLIVDAVTYGMCIFFIGFTIMLFLKEWHTKPKSSWIFIICICLSEFTLFLYLLANTKSLLVNFEATMQDDVWWGLGLDLPGHSDFDLSVDYWSIIIDLTLPITLLLGDFLVVYRAWAIWPFNRYVKIILIILTALNIGVQILIVTLAVSPSLKPSFIFEIDSSRGFRFFLLEDALFSSNDTMGVTFSFIINAGATFLIGLKAWLHRKDLQELGFQFSKAQQVLLLWIDSGFIFGVLQLLYAVSGFVAARLIPDDGLSQNFWVSVVTWLGILIPLVGGILPCCIFIIVHMKMSVVEETISLQTVNF